MKRREPDELPEPELHDFSMLHYEASSDVRESAAKLRGVHLAFLEVGFDDDQAFAFTMAIFEANTQSG